MKEWAFQWKMSFNPGPSKQAQEVIFTSEVKLVVDPPIFLVTKQFNKFRHKNTWVFY